ncbi:hypothetical protein JXA70_14840 [candidate division KSB1 bacterium]|nr:hypothetical protein [candidate division KSB1 bacterium]
MFGLIASHLAAGLIPILVFLVLLKLRSRKYYKQYRESFWERQNHQSLQQTGVFSLDQIPRPPDVTTERDNQNMVLQTIAACQVSGLFEKMLEQTSLGKNDVVRILRAPEYKVDAVIQLLLAANVLQSNDSGYELTNQARLYLVAQSPFYTPLHAPMPAQRFLHLLRVGKRKGARTEWKSGKSYDPERIAIQQHQQSFPIGFALHNTNILGNAEHILDVAGGMGSICVALALKDANRRLEIIELPDSVPVAEKLIAKFNLTERISCRGMNMFTEEWPDQMDALLFTNILHDWDKTACTTLLKKAYQSLKAGGIVAIQEALMNDDKSGPLWTAHMSMNMALFTHGRQYNRIEIETLLQSAGFVDIRHMNVLGYYSSIYARKPS